MSPRKFQSQRRSARGLLGRRARQHKTDRSTLRFEALESRRLLAMDLLSSVSATPGLYPGESPQAPSSIQTTVDADRWESIRSEVPSERLTLVAKSESSQLVIMDASLANQQDLLRHLNDADFIVLDPTADGIKQISHILRGYDKLETVHLVSHGSSGTLHLGQTQLQSGNLDEYSDQLRSWNASLSAGADILVYGCRVAEGPLGKGFVEDFSALTGADVAASDDLTGNPDLGGDWHFEFQLGEIESGNAFSPSAREGLDTLLEAMPDLSQETAPLSITIKNGNRVTVVGGTNPGQYTVAAGATIKGGHDNDRFIIEAGADLNIKLDGGHGSNTLDLSDKTVAHSVTVDGKNQFSVTAQTSGGPKLTAKNIGGIVGGTSKDSFKFEAGLLFGRGQLDSLLDGGGSAGNTIDFSGYKKGVTVELPSGVAPGVNEARDGGPLSGLRNVQYVVGSHGADRLIGTDRDAGLGHDGNERLEGGKGADTLAGKSGDDTLVGGPGNDVYQLENSWGNDTIVESNGEGVDTLNFEQVTHNLSFTSTSGKLSVVATNPADMTTVTDATISDNSGSIERIVAGTGDHSYSFTTSWTQDLVIDNSNSNNATLDFSSVDDQLTFTVSPAGKSYPGSANKVVVKNEDGHSITAYNIFNLSTGTASHNKIEFVGTAQLPGQLSVEANDETIVLDYSKYELVPFINVGDGYTFETKSTVRSVNQVGTDKFANKFAGWRIGHDATDGDFRLAVTINGEVITTGDIPHNARNTGVTRQHDISKALENAFVDHFKADGETVKLDVKTNGAGTLEDPWIVTFPATYDLITAPGRLSDTKEDRSISVTNLVVTSNSLKDGGAAPVTPIIGEPGLDVWSVWNNADNGSFQLSIQTPQQPDAFTTEPINYRASKSTLSAKLADALITYTPKLTSNLQLQVTGEGTREDPWLIASPKFLGFSELEAVDDELSGAGGIVTVTSVTSDNRQQLISTNGLASGRFRLAVAGKESGEILLSPSAATTRINLRAELQKLFDKFPGGSAGLGIESAGDDFKVTLPPSAKADARFHLLTVTASDFAPFFHSLDMPERSASNIGGGQADMLPQSVTVIAGPTNAYTHVGVRNSLEIQNAKHQSLFLGSAAQVTLKGHGKQALIVRPDGDHGLPIQGRRYDVEKQDSDTQLTLSDRGITRDKGSTYSLRHTELFDKGSVEIVAGKVSLTGDTWPIDADLAELKIDAAIYAVESRDSDTQLTLVDHEVNKNSGQGHQLVVPKMYSDGTVEIVNGVVTLSDGVWPSDLVNGELALDSEFTGTPGADDWRGGPLADSAKGLAGDDTLKGAAGHDVLKGGAGVDHLWGGTGNDELVGGAGDDIYHFENGWGHDTIGLTTGKDGNDTLDYSGVVLASEATLTHVISEGQYNASDGAFLQTNTRSQTLGFYTKPAPGKVLGNFPSTSNQVTLDDARLLGELKLPAGDNTLLFGDNWGDGFTINSSQVVQNGGQLLLDFHDYSDELRFTFDRKSDSDRESAVGTLTIDVFSFGPKASKNFNRITVTHVDGNTTILGGGGGNTFVAAFDRSYEFPGTIVGYSGFASLTSQAINVAQLVGLGVALPLLKSDVLQVEQLPSTTVVNTIDFGRAGKLLRPSNESVFLGLNIPPQVQDAGKSLLSQLPTPLASALGTVSGALSDVASFANSQIFNSPFASYSNINNVKYGPGLNLIQGDNFNNEFRPAGSTYGDVFLEQEYPQLVPTASLMAGMLGADTYRFGETAFNPFAINTAVILEVPNLGPVTDVFGQDTLDLSGYGPGTELRVEVHPWAIPDGSGGSLGSDNWFAVWLKNPALTPILDTVSSALGSEYDGWLPIIIGNSIETILGGGSKTTVKLYDEVVIKGRVVGSNIELDYSEYFVDADGTGVTVDLGSGLNVVTHDEIDLSPLGIYPANKLVYGSATGIRGERLRGLSETFNLTLGDLVGTDFTDFAVAGVRSVVGSTRFDTLTGSVANELFIPLAGATQSMA